MNLIGKCPLCLSRLPQTPEVLRRLSVVCNATDEPVPDDGVCRCGQPFTWTTEAEHEARMAALTGKGMITCICCPAQFPDKAALLEHSATCPGHPAVILAKQLRAACITARNRFDEQNGQVSYEVWGNNYPAVKALVVAIAASASIA